MTHLSHTHYVCEAPPDNPLLITNFLILKQVLQIEGWVLFLFFFFFLGLKSILYIALFFNFVGFFFSLG